MDAIRQSDLYFKRIIIGIPEEQSIKILSIDTW